MNNIQILINELNNFKKDCTVRIENSYQYDAGNDLTEHNIVMFGKNHGHIFDILFINKETGEFKFESELNITTDLDNYYECFEGGFECDIEWNLQTLINNIKKLVVKGK